jgi:hypothetical protein
MSDTPADPQGRPHPERRPDERLEPTPTTPHNPGGLMPDIRGKAAEQGRDPNEVDPLLDDEESLRRMSGDPGRKLP